MIKAEMTKLKKIFADIPKDKRKLVEHLIQNASFMSVTLLELQEEVNEHGAIVKCVSGNGFETIKDNPAQKAYTTMISRYSQIISQLQNLLPDTKTDGINKAGETLAMFVGGGKKVESR